MSRPVVLPAIAHRIDRCVTFAGVEKVEVMMDKETNQARGFGFIAFYNNAAATLALRKLSRPEFRLRGHQVQVMWADPKRDEIGTEKVRASTVAPKQ